MRIAALWLLVGLLATPALALDFGYNWCTGDTTYYPCGTADGAINITADGDSAMGLLVATRSRTHTVAGSNLGIVSFAFADNLTLTMGAWPLYTEGHRMKPQEFALGLGEFAIVNRVPDAQAITPYSGVNMGSGTWASAGAVIDCGNGRDGKAFYLQYNCTNGFVFITNNGGNQPYLHGYRAGITFNKDSLVYRTNGVAHAIELAAGHGIIWYNPDGTVQWSLYGDATGLYVNGLPLAVAPSSPPPAQGGCYGLRC